MKSAVFAMPAALCLLAVALVGCDNQQPPVQPHDNHVHKHDAPHGGTLVPLGDHAAHVEFVMDKDTGLMRAYILDGEATGSIRVSQKSFVVRIAPQKEGEEPTQLRFMAKKNDLTGETVGDTSQFEAIISDALKNISAFQGVLESLTIKETPYTNIEFQFPGDK